MEKKPTRDEFEFEGELKIRHKPTDATITSLQHADPDDTAAQVTVTWGRAGEVLPNGDEYEPDEIKQMAAELLRERAMSGKK